MIRWDVSVFVREKYYLKSADLDYKRFINVVKRKKWSREVTTTGVVWSNQPSDKNQNFYIGGIQGAVNTCLPHYSPMKVLCKMMFCENRIMERLETHSNNCGACQRCPHDLGSFTCSATWGHTIASPLRSGGLVPTITGRYLRGYVTFWNWVWLSHFGQGNSPNKTILKRELKQFLSGV